MMSAVSILKRTRKFEPEALLATIGNGRKALLFAKKQTIFAPPNDAPFWAKLIFFFLTGLIFSLLSYICRSILPGVILHFVALFLFFVYIWPHDTERLLLSQGSDHKSFYLSLAQTALFSALSVLAFRRLSQEARTISNR
jgi:hypothetical protein